MRSPNKSTRQVSQSSCQLFFYFYIFHISCCLLFIYHATIHHPVIKSGHKAAVFEDCHFLDGRETLLAAPACPTQSNSFSLNNIPRVVHWSEKFTGKLQV